MAILPQRNGPAVRLLWRRVRFAVTATDVRHRTEPAAKAIEQPVHFAAEGLPYIGHVRLCRGCCLLYFNRYVCHRRLRQSLVKGAGCSPVRAKCGSSLDQTLIQLNRSGEKGEK